MALPGDQPVVGNKNPTDSKVDANVPGPGKTSGRRNVSLARLIKGNRAAITRLGLKPESTVNDLMDGLRDEALEDLLK